MRLGNIVAMIQQIPSSIYNFLLLRYKKVILPRNSEIRGRIYICGTGSVHIAEKVKINSCLSSNPIGGSTRMILNTCEHGTISIGYGTGISNSSIVAMQSVSIGKNVRIGGGCQLFDNDFHSLSYENRIGKHDTDIASKPICIQDGAFVGAGCIILKGVTIGEKSIIGAGSTVTKNVPPGEIWAGNPARFIKKTEDGGCLDDK